MRNDSLPMTRISTRKSIEIEANNKHSDSDTNIKVVTERHDRRKQTLKTILRDEAPVFLSHEEVVVSDNLKKGRKASRTRQKSDLSRPPLRGGLTETKTRCIQVTEEVGKALRTSGWQNRKEEAGSVSFRNRQPANFEPDMNVNSAVSRKRASMNMQPHKESTPTTLNKVRENRKASRCCAECKAVVYDREKLRLRGALGVKICDGCWSKKKPKEPKEVHVAAEPVLPRAPSPTVKKCLVKLFDVSRYPAGHPFGKGFLSQRTLKRRFNEPQDVDDAASEMIVQPKRARKSGNSTLSADTVNSTNEDQQKDSEGIFLVNSVDASETGSKESTRAAANSRSVSCVTADVITSNKNEKTSRRKSEQFTAENTGQEILQEKELLSQLKVNSPGSPERKLSKRSNINTETKTTKTRTSIRNSSNNESVPEKRTLRKSSLNAENPPEKGMSQKGREKLESPLGKNVESPTDKKPERSSTNAEFSSERKSRRSSMNAEIASEKKMPQRGRVNVETTSEKMVSQRSSVNGEISGGKKTLRSSTSTEATSARISRRKSVNTESTSEIRILRRNSSSNETTAAATTTTRQSSISNNMSKSALSAQIQSKNKNLPTILRKGQNQVISSGKSKTAATKLETKSNRNPSKSRLTQIKSVKLRKVLPEAAIAKNSHIIIKKKQLMLQQNKLKSAIPVTSRKGSVLPKYSKQAEKPLTKRIPVLKRKTDTLKNRISLSRESRNKKSVFGQLHSKTTTVQRVKKPDINILNSSAEKMAASRKRKIDLSDKSPNVKKRKIESVPARRKERLVEKELERAKDLTYKCDMCNKRFSSLAEERLHELSHSGRQPILVLHKCDSPQGVLSLIREDDFSSLNIFSSDTEIQKDVAHEVNMRCDSSSNEVNTEANMGTVERKDDDSDTIQLVNLENTDELKKLSANKSFEIVETDGVCDIDQENSAPFDNCNPDSVLETQEVEYSEPRIHSDSDICLVAEVDKNKTDTILEDTSVSKAVADTSKPTSAVCSSEIAKKPKSSDEIAVLLEEIFGESSEEDLISVTGIRNLRQTADALNTGIDKTSESSTEKPTCGVNTLQHTSVNHSLEVAVPKCSPSDTAEVVSQYLRGETHNPEEILQQLNYGDKTVTENETDTSTKTSSDTDQADSSIKLPSDALSNSHKDGDSEGGSPETSCVTNIEPKVTSFKDDGNEGNRSQLVVDESEVLNSQQQQPQSLGDTVCAEENILEPSTDITDSRNQNLNGSAEISDVGENNVLEDKNSDEKSMKVDYSLEVNKDFSDSISKHNSVAVSVNGSIILENSCKQSKNETVNQNVGHPDAHCIDNTHTRPDPKCEADSGDTHNVSVVAESVSQKQQQTGNQEEELLLDTTNNPAINEILETCDESELPSEICSSKQTLEHHEKEQPKSCIDIQDDDSTEKIQILEQVNSDSEIVQQVECIDNSDLLNNQNACEVSEVTKTENDASEKCHKDTSTCFKTPSQPEKNTSALGEGPSPADLVHTGNNEKKEDVLQNEISETEVGTSSNGVIKDVLLIENNETHETLDSASTDIVSVTEMDSRHIAVHSPSEATTKESMEIDSEKNSNATELKRDESEVKDAELVLLGEPDSVCDASQEINSSHQASIQDNMCNVSSLNSDSKMVVSDNGHDIECETISTTLDNDPEVKIDSVEQKVESPKAAHTVEALNASHVEENVLQPKTLDPEHKVLVLNSDNLNAYTESPEMQATNDCSTKDDDNDDCKPCISDDADNSDKRPLLPLQGSSKEGTPVNVNKTCQSVDSTNLVVTKEESHCQMEHPSADCAVNTTGKSDEIHAESTAQEIETKSSSCDTQAVDSSCVDRTDGVNSKIETRHLNFEIELKEPGQGTVTENVNHEDEFVSASEVVSDEVVVALNASSEGDALVSGDEVGADVQFVPSSDLNNTNSEMTAGISDSIPSIVGVENLSFNVRHNVPDVFEEEEQILQEVEEHSILQEPDCTDRNVETLTKGQNEIHETETEDNTKPPLVAGLNGITEKVIGECSTKVSGNGDLKDNLHLDVSGDNDITGLEPISDDELDFM